MRKPKTVQPVEPLSDVENARLVHLQDKGYFRHLYTFTPEDQAELAALNLKADKHCEYMRYLSRMRNYNASL